MAATTLGLLPVFRWVEGWAYNSDVERGCETTDTVTTSGSPPQSTLQSPNYWNATRGSRKTAGAARALHYDYDYNDHSEREQRVLGEDRRTRRLQRQELLSWLYVIVCVTTITTTWRRKRDRLLWSLPQEYGTRRRVPLRHNDRIDCYGYNHAGSTTGEVVGQENNDIVRLHHQTDWQTTEFAIKMYAFLFTKTAHSKLGV